MRRMLWSSVMAIVCAIAPEASRTTPGGAMRGEVKDKQRGLLAGRVVGGTADMVQQAEPRIIVGPTVHVSAALSDVFHDEVTLAADHTDARRLIACSMIDPSPGGTERWTKSAAYLSFDGGRTWTHGITSGLDTGDPTCEYAPDGSVYFVALASRTRWDRLGTAPIELHRSPDGGHTWETPRLSAGGDRPWLVVDRTSTVKPTPIYVTYHTAIRPLRDHGRPAPFGLYLKRSDDGGVTWAAPAVRLGELDNHESSGVTPQRADVLFDGTIVILYLAQRDFPGALPARPPLVSKGLAQYVTTSNDGGRTLGDGVKVADSVQLSGMGGTTGGFASLAADPGSASFKDRLYAAWCDARTGRTEIWFSFSDNKGVTWSAPRVVSDDSPWPPPASGPDHAMPTLAVSKHGVVGLLWYDRRESPDNVGFYPRFRASFDGGETWLPSVRVSEMPNQFEAGEAVRLWSFVRRGSGSAGPISLALWRHWWVINGHTAGLAADASGAFHALWVDNRTGVNQVYSARIDVEGAAIRHGHAELATREDVTPLVAVDLNGATFDSKKHTITVRARLRNTSGQTLVGPLILRVLAASSEIGTARVTNADRGASEGAVWSFETSTDGLAPHETTTERTLDLQLSPSRAVKEGLDVRLGLVTLDVKILGHTK